MIQFSCFSEKGSDSTRKMVFTGNSAILSQLPIDGECIFNTKDTANDTGQLRGTCTHQSLGTSTAQIVA